MKKLNLGRRKICKVNYTKTVSLPKVWLENVGLRANDYVELVMEDDGSLVIKPLNKEATLVEPREAKDR